LLIIVALCTSTKWDIFKYVCLCICSVFASISGLVGNPWDAANPLQALKSLQTQAGSVNFPENTKVFEQLHMLQEQQKRQLQKTKGRLSGMISEDNLFNDGKDQDQGPLRVLLTQQEQQQRAAAAAAASSMAAPIGQPKVGRPRRQSQLRGPGPMMQMTPQPQHSTIAGHNPRDTSPQRASMDPDSSSGKDGLSPTKPRSKMDNMLLKQLLSQYDNMASPPSPGIHGSHTSHEEPKKHHNALLKVRCLFPVLIAKMSLL
jgi:hypothetical protein